MKYDILLEGSPQLKMVSSDIINIDNEIRYIAIDMLETMYNSNGIGLAAPQIGKNIRLIVWDTSVDKTNPKIMINPIVLESNDNTMVLNTEGCLSVPDKKILIPRVNRIKVKYKDQFGDDQLEYFEGIDSIVIQHECDHLNGILISNSNCNIHQNMKQIQLNNMLI